MQASVAMAGDLEAAESGEALARLLWLLEDLMYRDLLKGTGWGRRRQRFRDLLEAAKTVSQVDNHFGLFLALSSTASLLKCIGS